MNTDLQKTIQYIIFGGDVPEISNPELLFDDMKRHCLVPLLGTGGAFKKLQFPDLCRSDITNFVNRHLRTFCMVSSEQSELTELLAGINVKPIILKGFSAAKYYPEPAYRPIGDIDFLVKGDYTAEKVADFLSDNGYNVEDYSNPSYYRHISIENSGVKFELHRYFSQHDCEYDYEIDRILDSAGFVAEQESDGCFYSFPDAENGLVLLDHINHHLSGEGIGFRQIIDWMCYVSSVLTDEFWNNSFRDIAGRAGLIRLAIHVTRMCELIFGLPEHDFSSVADENACLQLAEYIYSSGNFGVSSDAVTVKISSVLSEKNLFKRLQSRGLMHWAAARKYRILRPFAWIYQIFRIIHIMLRPSSIKKLGSGKDVASIRDSLYRTLGVSSYRTGDVNS